MQSNYKLKYSKLKNNNNNNNNNNIRSANHIIDINLAEGYIQSVDYFNLPEWDTRKSLEPFINLRNLGRTQYRLSEAFGNMNPILQTILNIKALPKIGRASCRERV